MQRLTGKRSIKSYEVKPKNSQTNPSVNSEVAIPTLENSSETKQIFFKIMEH